MLSSLFMRREVIRARKLITGGSLAHRSIEESFLAIMPDSFTRFLDYAGIVGKKRNVWVRKVLIQIFFVSCIAVFFGFVQGLLVGCFFVFLQCISLKLLNRKRVLSFDRDYPAFLLSLRSSIRTGHDPLTALTRSGVLFNEGSVMRREIATISLGLEKGMTEEDALKNFALSVHHPDVPLFRVGFMLARIHGASLAPCIDRLVRTTRLRQSFRRKIASSVAMQKLSSFGVAGCAVIVPLMQLASRPEDLIQAWNHPLGGKVLVIGVGCVFGGLGWMLSMTRAKL